MLTNYVIRFSILGTPQPLLWESSVSREAHEGVATKTNTEDISLGVPNGALFISIQQQQQRSCHTYYSSLKVFRNLSENEINETP